MSLGYNVILDDEAVKSNVCGVHILNEIEYKILLKETTKFDEAG